MWFLIIITIVVVGFFAITFLKMIKQNNSNYMYLLFIEFIGILIDFVFLIMSKVPNVFGLISISLFSIIFPIISFLLEKNNIFLEEIFSVLLSKMCGKDDLDSLLKLRKKHPNSFRVHKLLAEYYERNNEIEKAESECYEALEIRPNDYKLYCKLAKLLSDDNKSDDAINILQRLLYEKPDYYQGSILLGEILYNNEKFKEAINVYNQALKYNPGEFDLYYCLGMTYTRLNDFQYAKECYKKAATLNSIKDVSNLNVGQIYLLFKEYEKAEQYFYETIKSDDEKVSAYSYYYLAKIRLIQGNENQAIQYMNMAIETYPKISKVIEKDDMFIQILSKMNKVDEKEVSTKLKKKDLEIITYLGNTFNMVENLTNDMGMNKEKNDDKMNENEIIK